MLPGKKYVPEDFVRIAWTRKWFILVPAVLIGGATFLYSYFLPDQYRASTTIMVVPQRVPENYVRPTVTADVSERLQTISQQILSRTRLERIIEEFNLYAEDRKTAIMEDVVEQMRRDVALNVAAPRSRNEDASSFTVSYVAPQPRTAMLVTERLASLFVQENLQERELLADSTSQFLQAQLEDARRRLLEHEQKLEAFRRLNSGRLPSQASSNLQMLENTQTQMQANAEAANRDRDRLLMLDTAIAEVAQAPAAGVTTAPGAEPVLPAAQQLEAARNALRSLELRLTPEHPDIRRAKRVIAELEEKATAEAAAAPAGETEPALGPALAPGVVTKLASMRLEAEEIRNRLGSRKQEEDRLKALLAAYSARLEAVPGLESELTELMRDYDTVQASYDSLKRKSEEATMAANLERRQIGEQFKVVDGARLPERPFSPDRVRLNLMGLAAGIGLGLGFVVLLEYRDTTLKTDSDVLISLALPVLAVIPAMETDQERRRTRRKHVLLGAAATMVVLLAAAAYVAWKLRIIQEKLQFVQEWIS
jgi:polysaccharide chain length determinant protein (PEP-CTERM system associated)